jgi:hypothetical protein
MDNEFLLSPFFLDSSAPLMDRLAQPAWIVNRPAIDGSNLSAHGLPEDDHPKSDGHEAVSR